MKFRLLLFTILLYQTLNVKYKGREQKSINYVSNKKYYKSYKSSSKENVMRQEGLNGIKRILRDRDVNYIFSMNVL